jgi:hypothetical protein
MDTRFWGPSGWKLLHLITFDYDYSSENAILYAAFFETLPYILPCKFCRSSLTDYYRIHPFSISNGWISPSFDLKRWMFLIHNCVNHKLREQGLNPNSDPTYKQVKKLYEKMHKCSWKQKLTYFWDFLFSVGYHHPKEKQLYSKPMPNCPPEVINCKDSCEKNKWNILPLKERIIWFERFWNLLPAVLPNDVRIQWKEAEKHNPPTLKTRHTTISWLWKMRCSIDTSFQDPYHSICKKIAHYSSDCGIKQGVFTCRKKHTKHSPRHTMKKR